MKLTASASIRMLFRRFVVGIRFFFVIRRPLIGSIDRHKRAQRSANHVLFSMDMQMRWEIIYLPASSPFPTFGRVQALFLHVTRALGQVAQTAGLRHGVHHTGARHGVDEGRLSAP